MCDAGNYQATLPNGTPNPQTKQQFARQFVRDFITANVKYGEIEKARRTVVVTDVTLT
ncbi:MAG: hypothetical protein M3Q33_06280 [Acidobacteriota bacterium]|nr:hypothetical protein [Acidobacteriota bacterium]